MTIETVLFLGGPKHGELQQVDYKSHSIVVVVPKPFTYYITKEWNTPTLLEEISPYEEVEYKYQGVWSGYSGHTPIFTVDGSKWVMIETTGEATVEFETSPVDGWFKIMYFDPAKSNGVALIRQEVFVYHKLFSDYEWDSDRQLYVLKDPVLWSSNISYESKKKIFEHTVEHYKQAIKEQIQKESGGLSSLSKGQMTKGKSALEMSLEILAAHHGEYYKGWQTYAWMRAGLVDEDRTLPDIKFLCRECADMLLWPDAPSLLTESVKESRRKLVRQTCSYCGAGYFDHDGIKVKELPCQPAISIQDMEQ